MLEKFSRTICETVHPVEQTYTRSHMQHTALNMHHPERSIMRHLKWTLLIAALWSTAAGYTYAANAGRAIYAAHCSACHGANGQGALPGTPNFSLQGGVLSLPDSVLLNRIENGYQAAGAPMPMPAKGGDPALTHEELTQVLGYIRANFGQKK